MKRLVCLLLCLSFSLFAVARAMKPSQMLAAVARGADNKPPGQKADAKTLLNDANGKKLEEAYAENESFDMSESEANEEAAEEDTDDEVASADDDSMEDASDDEGEDVVDDDGANDDSGGDDNGGDDGGDDGD